MASQTNRLIWWAMVASLGLYVVLAHTVPVPGGSGSPIGILLPVLAGIALASGIAGVVYRRHALAEPIRSGALDPTRPPGLQRAFQVWIVSVALSESVGIYGLVLALLSGDPVYADAFCAAGLYLMYLHRPTAEELAPPLSGRSGPAGGEGASHPGPLHR